MIPRRTLAALFTTLFVAMSLAPLAFASTGPSTSGDVVVNGAFGDTTPIGHPQKFYCDAACGANAFVAFDWTTAVEYVDLIEVVEGGIRVHTGAFLQQHFNGTDAPDRLMQLSAVEITARAASSGAGGFRVEIRGNTTGDSAAESYTKSVSVGTSMTTLRVAAADLAPSAGAPAMPAGAFPMRSIRLWSNANADLVIERVSVYATNGVDARNLPLTPAGDDVVTTLGGAILQSPGADGKYTFRVGMAADNGDFLPTLDAWLCLYDLEQALADRGYPANSGGSTCPGSHLRLTPDHADAGITRVKSGESFLFHVDPAKALSDDRVAAFGVYAFIKADKSYDDPATPYTEEFRSGYLHVGRLAADAAGAGVSNEFYGPTPVFVDANGDGRPDYVQPDEADGYSVIVTPVSATETPGVSIVTSADGVSYDFDVQVYKYDGITGAPLALPGGVALGVFDADGLVNGGSFDSEPFWTAGGADQERLADGKTIRVKVPVSEMPKDKPVGIWSFYNVGEPMRHNVASMPYGGASQSATDFYSVARNGVKDVVIADALRLAGTPIVFADPIPLAQSTAVIRLDASVDELTPVDGTLVLGDGGDGTITFEYALVTTEGARLPVGGSHGLAIYDTAGVLSDDLQPGSRQLKHAEFFGVGTQTADNWFRIDVPLSAFENAKGPIGAWAYVDTQTPAGLESRSTYFNLLKPTVAALSPAASEAALYGPTPLVVLDSALGIPLTLAAAVDGLGTALASPTNPLVNPGFEADLLVEGYHDRADATGGTMTSPPWFFRLDDGAGAGNPTIPRSTHEVATGKGRSGDNALAIQYRFADYAKGLMLGQLLGNEDGSNGLVWKGATGVEMDIKTTTPHDLKFTVAMRYLDAEGDVKFASKLIIVEAASGWQRPVATFTTPVPADGVLLGLYIQPKVSGDTRFFVDNVVVKGAKTAFGDARTDLTDGYAMVIEPNHLANGVQSRVTGATGEFYLYDVTVMDYTKGGAQTLRTTDIARAFGLRTDDLQKELGIPLTLRGEDETFVAAIPAADAPATPAAPWAWVRAGDAYFPFESGIAAQPASGYYSPLKNSLAGTAYADQLDYAGTPVVFGSSSAQTLSAQQTITLVPRTAGGYDVFVGADSPFIETTTVTVSAPDVASRAATVALTGNLVKVPGLVLTESEYATATITTSDTLFTRSATLVAGSPIASFFVCRPEQPGCLADGIMSGELLEFHSTSTSPTGEPLTHVWTFGDGSVVTTPAADTTHRYVAPGDYTGNLTVQTPSGKRAVMPFEIQVNNRAPVLAGIDVIPTSVFTDSQVRLRARASDSDFGTLSYAWTLDGMGVPGVTGREWTITPSLLDEITGVAGLERRAYEFSVTVMDGQGGLTTGEGLFLVQDRATVVGAPSVVVVGFPNATYALPGEEIQVSVMASDIDDAVSSVVLDLVTPTGATSVPLALVSGAWTATLPVSDVGEHTLVAVAFVDGATEGTPGGPTVFEARADAAPVLSVTGPTAADVGDEGAYLVTASDPDGRGAVLVEISAEGASVVGATSGPAGSTFLVSLDTMGEAIVSARAIDATGAEATAQVLTLVDDVIHVELTVERAPEGPTQGYLVRVKVTDVLGAPIAGVQVQIEDFYDPLPRAISTQTLTTGADGSRVFRVDPEAGLVGLPLARHLIATVSAQSHVDAPVGDEETASARLELRNPSEPFAGLPLP